MSEALLYSKTPEVWSPSPPQTRLPTTDARPEMPKQVPAGAPLRDRTGIEGKDAARADILAQRSPKVLHPGTMRHHPNRTGRRESAYAVCIQKGHLTGNAAVKDQLDHAEATRWRVLNQLTQNFIGRGIAVTGMRGHIAPRQKSSSPL